MMRFEMCACGSPIPHARITDGDGGVWPVASKAEATSLLREIGIKEDDPIFGYRSVFSSF